MGDHVGTGEEENEEEEAKLRQQCVTQRESQWFARLVVSEGLTLCVHTKIRFSPKYFPRSPDAEILRQSSGCLQVISGSELRDLVVTHDPLDLGDSLMWCGKG